MNELKKQQIVNVSIDLFAECGIAKVSIARIAKELGASRGKIYHYFKSGKNSIITEILQIYEACVSSSIPNPKEWESKDIDAEKILFELFFQFPAEDGLRLRKIVRIIMSEMYWSEQIAEYAQNYFIIGREKLLAECFQALANNGKISLLDAESAARYFNRLLSVYATEDALRYPYAQDTKKADAQLAQMVRDCTYFLNCFLGKH